MYSSHSQQELFEAISNLTEQQVSLVLQFITLLKTSTDNHSSSQTVLERMGGYPEILLEESANLSDRDIRRQAIAERIQLKQQMRNDE